MSDFQIQVGGDFGELLRGFQQLESRAQQSGQNVGKGLADGIQGYSSKSIAALQAELTRLEQRQIKVAVDSTAFEKTGKKITEIKALIAEVEKRRLTLNVDDRSITALQTKLAQLQSKQTKLDVDSSEFIDAQKEINKLEAELNDISRKKLLIDADANSALAVTAKLQGELDKLRNKQLKIDVDSAEFAEVSREIDRVEGELSALEKKKLLINADPSSIIALRTNLGELQAELDRTKIGSQRFQELSAAIRETEQELARAGESTDQFRILDGVVQGIAFSLSNSVVEGAQQAIAALGNVVAEFGRLDTELRKAAAASGEAGAYESLARNVEQVGIEAAGTTLEVAELNTELIRGGMTVDQANASLAAIVRGAEATGTSFANMGSVVSASLKGFGLEAKDAQRVVDALVTGANASAASVDGMGMAFKYAAPVAKILGVSVEDLGVAIGLLTNAGIDASEAGVTLRNGLSKLATAAPKAGGAMRDLSGQSAMAAKAIQALGVNIYNANGTLRPMEEVLLKLKSAFDKLEPASKIKLASNLFGGEDDGTKWLALLNQSETEIKKMAAAMANTKGATDTARDAMQGFEMKLKALDGSLGAIGNTFGSITAAALIPFVDAANLIVGAIVALPGPVKTLAAGLALLTGAVAVGTAGMVAFQAALASTQVQSTIAAVKALGAAILTNLAGASTVAIVAVDTLYKAIKGFNIQSFFAGIGQLGTALKTQLAGAATVAATAFAELGKAIKSGAFANALKSIAGEIAAFAGGVLRLAAVIAPLAIAFGIVSKGMEGASQASERYKVANDEISKALVKLRDELDQTNIKIADSRNVLERLWDSFGEGSAVMGDISTTNALIQTLTSLNDEAKAYLATLGETGTLTDQQIAKANAYIVAIQGTTGAIQQLIQKFEEQAKKAELVGDQKQAEVYRNNAAALKEYADRVGETGAQLANKTRITAQDIVNTGQATQATKELADAQRQLNEVLATEPIRNLEAQLTVGNQLVSLSQALSAQEQSRFGIVKAGLEYELSKAQERKASESEIGRIKSQIQEVESNALRARYAALQQEQALQVQMLALSQQKARIESDLSIQQQELKVLEAAVKLQEAINSGKQSEIDQSRAVLDLQTAVLGTKYEGKAILEAVQPLERNILAVQQATTSNSLIEQAARLGIKNTLQASARPASDIANYSSEIATESKRAADQYANVAVETARGSKATNEAAKNTKTLAAGAKDAAKSTGDTAKAAGTASKGLDGSAKAAGGLKKELTDATKAAGGTSQNTGAIGNSAKQADQQMRNLGSTFQATQKTAAAAAQLAAQFSKTAGSVGGIAKAMVQAAVAAKAFYNTLLQASGLPGSRWTGGPVAAGQTVRINDGPAGRSLGQESFLSAAGRLSLINKPANALWTPPSSGVVIPAAVTDTLKARGVFDAGRAARAAITNKPAPRVANTDSQLAATVARQAIAIGKLEQAVNRLTDKDWNVHLKVRNTDNGASYLNTLNRML